jgi:TonB family protein
MARTFTHRRCRGRRLEAAFALLLSLLSLLPGFASHVIAQNEDKPHRKVLVSYQPVYPDLLAKGHFEGTVRLAASVQANGTVSKVETKGGNPMLARYAMEAVMKWKYAPAAASTVEEVSFHFSTNSFGTTSR